MISDDSTDGMKALLLDDFTKRLVSLSYTQTQIMEKDVVLVERLDKKHEIMRHLKAIVFVKPTEANIKRLALEVKNPSFREYHIYFTNCVLSRLLAILGKADEMEVVKQVYEFYFDFVPINEEFFHLGLNTGTVMTAPNGRAVARPGTVEQHLQGLQSFLLAMKLQPSDVRYAISSAVGRKVAEKLTASLNSDLFGARPQASPLVLILDRKDDPITPLLTQWTYQSMIHELLGFNDGRVSLNDAPGVSKDLQDVVLDPKEDAFYKCNRRSNFGDLGTAVKTLMDNYQKQAKKNDNISSIEDMQNFLERYPAFRSQSINVSKHVALLGELARLIERYNLFHISQLEQEIACSSNQAKHFSELRDMLMDASIQAQDRLRMAMLYCIRYESSLSISEVKAMLHEGGLRPEQTIILDAMLSYAGEKRRAPGLFSGGGFIASISKQIVTSIHGVDNVYTQHVPLLSEIIDSITAKNLNASSYPSMMQPQPNTDVVNTLVIFVIGGVTYEEATNVAEFNADGENTMKVYLGGSCIHNSTSFQRDVHKAFNDTK